MERVFRDYPNALLLFWAVPSYMGQPLFCIVKMIIVCYNIQYGNPMRYNKNIPITPNGYIKDTSECYNKYRR